MKHVKSVVSLTTLLLSACAHQADAQSSRLDTSVSGGHAAVVTRDIQGWHNSKHPNCPYTRAVEARVVERDSDGVVEIWTIEGCDGKRFDYEAYIMPMGGGISVMVGDIDASSLPVAP